MGGAANCALVALLLLLASGYRIVHRDPGKRLKITLIATVVIYGLVQLACGITTTLVGCKSVLAIARSLLSRC